MIGRIQGILLLKKPPFLLVDVGGLGYEIQAPMSTFYRLPHEGAKVTLLTHFVVREDAQLLYGFISEEERSLFRELIKVSGVGPKLGLSILSGMEPNEFVMCVMDGDLARLVKIPGVGKKTAERLLVEVRDKLKDFHTESFKVDLNLNPGQASGTGAMRDALSALVALGYKANEAQRALSDVAKDTEEGSETLIRYALGKLLRVSS